jgi:hypothetical protein
MKHYWRYIIARYGAYPVTWTVAGETTLTYYRMDNDRREEMRQFQREGWADVARFIKATDPFERIVTAHPGPSSGRYRPINEMSLLDIVMVQPGHNGWESLPAAFKHLRTAQDRFPDKPVMQGEVCFEGMHGGGSDAKLQRILFWANMMSGAAGHCYGADAIWQMNTEEELFGPTAGPGGHIWGNAPLEEAYQWKGSYFVGLGRKILEQFAWQQFELHFYPGDQYIDISGIDIYPSEGLGWPMPQESSYQKAFDIMSKVTPGKMLAFGEGGAIPNPDMMANEGPKWLYCLPWWAEHQQNPKEWVRKTFNHPLMVTLDELPDWDS